MGIIATSTTGTATLPSQLNAKINISAGRSGENTQAKGPSLAMLALPPPLGALLLCALLTPAHAVPPRLLFQRKDTCADQKLASCPSDVPDNFCCPAKTKCIPLAGGTTAICCPEGGTCQKISPLTCNVALQDPEKFPSAGLKTTVRDGQLERCGEECCPFGYTCNDDDECVMDEDQSEPPARASESESAAAPSETTGSTTPTSISDEGSTNGDTKGGAKDGEAVPTTAIVVGVLLGVLGLVGAVVFFLLWRSKRRQKTAGPVPPKLSKPSPRTSVASSSFGNDGEMPHISAPIGNPQTMRTDFVRKTESTRTAPGDRARDDPVRKPESAHAPSRRISRMYRSGPTSARSVSSASTRNSTAVPPIRGMNTSSRVSAVSSMTSASRRGEETIDYLAPPGPVGERRDTAYTSFSGLMAEVEGLAGGNRGPPRI